MEIGSNVLTLPVGLLGYKLYLEKKRPIKRLSLLNKYLKSFILISLPSFHFFSWTMYRRYF